MPSLEHDPGGVAKRLIWDSICTGGAFLSIVLMATAIELFRRVLIFAGIILPGDIFDITFTVAERLLLLLDLTVLAATALAFAGVAVKLAYRFYKSVAI